MASNLKFIVDHNVGKLTRWLRMMGYDTLFFNGKDDWQMVRTALDEGRMILTRDTHIFERWVVTSGRVKAILIKSEGQLEQIRQVIETLHLDYISGLFTRCLECNYLLEKRTKEQVKDRVPPYVFKTQKQYLQCPNCLRVYWRGTHWQAMVKKLEYIKD